MHRRTLFCCTLRRQSGYLHRFASLSAGFSLACLSLFAGLPCLAEGVSLHRATAAGVPLQVTTVDLNNPNVKVTGMVVPRGRQENFNAMIRRTRPAAAFTGTYFCLQTRIPIGDIVVDGRQVHVGGMGTALCLTADNECEFIKPPRYRQVDWSAFEFVCSAGPRLVCAGRASVNPRAEGFRDPGLFRKAARLAVGITAENKLIFAATRKPITLSRMAKAMKALGCLDAINLDAGSSLGLYYKGKMPISPKRKLTNIILVYEDIARYEAARHHLTPPAAQAAR